MNFEFSHRYYKFQQWLIQSYKPYVTLSHSPSMTWLRNLVAEGCSKRHPDSCMRRSTVWLQERYSVKKPDQFHPHKYTACYDNSLPYFNKTRIRWPDSDACSRRWSQLPETCKRLPLPKASCQGAWKLCWSTIKYVTYQPPQTASPGQKINFMKEDII